MAVEMWNNYITASLENIKLFPFTTRLEPEQLGAQLYEALRSGLESDGDLSLHHLVDALDLTTDSHGDEYAGDVMIGLMFAATLATERSAGRWIAGRIVGGMKQEFFRHLAEQGATKTQQQEWNIVLEESFNGFRKCMDNYAGFEPPWKLGRQLYWTLLGDERHVAICVKIATLYLVEAEKAAQDLLNRFGPSLMLYASGTQG